MGPFSLYVFLIFIEVFKGFDFLRKKEKDKGLSHLIEVAKVYSALIHVRQVIKTLIMVTRLFAERNL